MAYSVIHIVGGQNYTYRDCVSDDQFNLIEKDIEFLTEKMITAKKWITQTNAVGIISKQGNNGGTLAHRDIALDFQMWLPKCGTS